MDADNRSGIWPASPRAAPGPRRYPALGMLPHLRNGPHEFFRRAALQYGGVVQLGRPDRLLVTHPDGVKHVLMDNQQNYVKGKYVERTRILVGNGLLVSDGALWLRHRRLMQPAFHRQRLASLATIVADLTAEMLDRWQRSGTRDRAIDVAAEMRSLTQQMIVKILFGADVGVAQVEAVGQAFETIIEYINYRAENPFPLPEHWPTSRNRHVKQATQHLDQFVNRIITERRENSGDAADLLSVLLAARDEETGEGMDNRQLYDEVRALFFAGYDTTSNVLAWVWHMLAQHPHVERRLHDELAATLGGRPPSYNDLSGLTYLRMVIEETLRIYPPAWVIVRTVVADDQIDGYHIPLGAKVLISPYVTHRLPSFWEHPELFEPDRFSPDRAAGRHRCAYIPFGIGPRMCIGSNLAMMLIQLIVAMVAQAYRMRGMPGHAVRMHPSLTLQPRDGLPMHLSAR